MEIGLSQSIITQDNTTGFMGPGYSSSTRWDNCWDNHKIILDVGTIFNLLGFQVFLLGAFIYFPFYYWLYISNQHKGEEDNLT